MNKRNANTDGLNASPPPEGWHEDEAERLAPGKQLYMAQARQERCRYRDSHTWAVDPDDTGAINYEERFFLRLADAEKWLLGLLAEWPAVVEDNGDALEATAEVTRVVFPPRDTDYPWDAACWEYSPGFEDRMYGEQLSPELKERAVRLAKAARRLGTTE